MSQLNFSFAVDFFQSLFQQFVSFNSGNILKGMTNASTTFLLIAAAEFGDKSQIVCMALASKHRAVPILLGAISAFALLNTLAVVFGVAIASWLPEYGVAAIVACLFAGFGLQALLTGGEEEDGGDIKEKSSHGIFLSTFLLITLAEFGDKTQLAVVALSSTGIPMAVWLGATVALGTTSAFGIWAGRRLLQKIPLRLLHQMSGGLFLILAFMAAYRAYHSFATL